MFILFVIVVVEKNVIFMKKMLYGVRIMVLISILIVHMSVEQKKANMFHIKNI